MTRQPAFICQNRHGMYYFRAIIPKHLKGLLRNQREIRVTLSTDSRKKATVLARAARVVFDRALNKRWNMNNNNTNDYYDSLLADIKLGVARADSITPGSGNELDPLDALELGERVRESEERQYTERLKKIYNAIEPIVTVLPSISAPLDEPVAEVIPDSIPTIREMATLAVSAERRRKGEKLGRRERYFIVCPKFFEFLNGNMQVDKITYQIVENFYYKLAGLPAALFHAKTKYKHIKNVTDLSKVTLDASKKVSSETRKKYIITLKNILDVAVRNGHIKNNPAANFPFETNFDEKPDNEKREPFDSKDLRKIFDRDFFKCSKGLKASEQSVYWMFVLALYTGARLGDLLYLGSESIKQEENGHWYINFINQTEAGKLIRKIKGSKSRQSPIHRTILELGFLEFVKSREGATYLFEHVTGVSESISTRSSSRMTNYLKDWGVHRTSLKTFHSLRHTVINHAEHELGIDIKIIAALAGHITGHDLTNLTTFHSYVSNKSVEFIKNEIVDKLSYGLEIER